MYNVECTSYTVHFRHGSACLKIESFLPRYPALYCAGFLYDYRSHCCPLFERPWGFQYTAALSTLRASLLGFRFYFDEALVRLQNLRAALLRLRWPSQYERPSPQYSDQTIICSGGLIPLKIKRIMSSSSDHKFELGS